MCHDRRLPARHRFPLLLCCSTWSLLLPSCLIHRRVDVDLRWSVPNRVHRAGFRYVKQGVTVQLRCKDIWPGRAGRSQAAARLNIADRAYRALVCAAGGLRSNERLVNVVVETTLVADLSGGDSSRLLVHGYADVIAFGRQPPAPPPPAAAGARRPSPATGSRSTPTSTVAACR